MRKRVPRPGTPEDGQRIVILGDSVAFGFGLEDHETFAERLEDFLAPIGPVGRSPPIASRSRVRAGPSRTPSVSCSTTSPTSGRTSCIYVPTDNELDDSFTVLESGHRSPDLDPACGRARPPCSLSYHGRSSHGGTASFPDSRTPRTSTSSTRGSPRSRGADTTHTFTTSTDLKSRLRGARCRFAIAGSPTACSCVARAQYSSAQGISLPIFPLLDGVQAGDMLSRETRTRTPGARRRRLADGEVPRRQPLGGDHRRSSSRGSATMREGHS